MDSKDIFVPRNCIAPFFSGMTSEEHLQSSLGNNASFSTDWLNYSQANHWPCSKCTDLSEDESVFCTCTEDPFDAVDVFKEVPYLRVTLATYFICIVFGAVGNLITLFTMATADRKNKTGTNIFLISLSVSTSCPCFHKCLMLEQAFLI